MAVWYRFSKDWDYEIRSPKGALQKTLGYRKDTQDFIPEAHAAAADAAGVGERTTKTEAQAEEPKASGKRK